MALSNARRRKDALVFAVLVSSTTVALEGTHFKQKYGAVFRHIPELDRAYAKSVPNEVDRKREISRVQLVVNGILPVNYQNATDEQKLWFAAQLVKRMVGSGWKPERDDAVVGLVQGLYNLADAMAIPTPPPASWNVTLARAPEFLRGYGMF